MLDADDGKGLETITCALYPDVPNGNTPNSLCLTPDGKMLFVANADANNLAVFNVAEPGKAKPLGFIPVGWYPTSVRYNPADKRLYVANGKGDHVHGQPAGARTPRCRRTADACASTSAGCYRGTLSIIDLPDPGADGRRTASRPTRAARCAPTRASPPARPEDNPIPGKVGDTSPIKHCIYIIKENRTYDQVFGDMKEGNGDPDLCLFPEKVTPNHHKLAREFVLLDNFYCDGEVSADGHEWSMGAYCHRFRREGLAADLSRQSARRRSAIPSEGNSTPSPRPAGGYIWDRCAEAKVSYRSYGEWIENGKKLERPRQAAQSRRWKGISIRCSAASTSIIPTRSGPTASSRN